MSTGSDRREHYRYDVDVSATIREMVLKGSYIKIKTKEVEVKDISISGVRIETDMKLPIHEGILYVVETIIENQMIIFNGEVVRKKKREVRQGIYEYGMRFSHIEEEKRKWIEKFIHTSTEGNI